MLSRWSQLYVERTIDTWEAGEDRKTIAQRERKHSHLLVLYDVEQVQAAEESQRTAVSSKCFQLYYTCSDRLLTIALPFYSFHLFSPLTVMFPKLSVILRQLYHILQWSSTRSPLTGFQRPARVISSLGP
jgi:hypothetical protein